VTEQGRRDIRAKELVERWRTRRFTPEEVCREIAALTTDPANLHFTPHVVTACAEMGLLQKVPVE
jgi:hypothetical protein